MSQLNTRELGIQLDAKLKAQHRILACPVCGWLAFESHGVTARQPVVSAGETTPKTVDRNYLQCTCDNCGFIMQFSVDMIENPTRPIPPQSQT